MILYFSQSGTTRNAAELIQQITGDELVALQPVTPYPKDYSKLVTVVQHEINQDVLPELARVKADLSKQDTVFLGFPTWYQQPPRLIASLFKNEDFSGKTVIPFTTSATSTIAESIPYLKKWTTADIQDGFTANSSSAITSFLQMHDAVNK